MFNRKKKPPSGESEVKRMKLMMEKLEQTIEEKDQQLKEKDQQLEQTIEEKDQQLEQTIEEKDQQLKEKDEAIETLKASVVDVGFPSIGTHTSMTKSPTKPIHSYDPVIIEATDQGDFRFGEDISLSKRQSQINLKSRESGLDYNQEKAPEAYCELLLSDVAMTLNGVLDELGLSVCVQYGHTLHQINESSSEVSMGPVSSSNPALETKEKSKPEGHQPDILLLCESGGRPLAAIEIKIPPSNKKPVNTVVSDPSFVAQLYDYMQAIQRNFGVFDVFGVLATYSQWQVYWMPESDALANRRVSYDDLKNRIGYQWTLDAPSAMSTRDRILHASRCFTVEEDGIGPNSTLLNTLVSLMLKTLCSRKTSMYKEVRRIAEMPYGVDVIRIRREGLMWVKLAAVDGVDYVDPSICVGENWFTGSNDRKVFLLRHLGLGYHGCAWVVGVVVKNRLQLFVAKLHSHKGNAKRELDWWNTIYGDLGVDSKKAHFDKVHELAGRFVLFLPYLRPVPDRDRTQRIPDVRTVLMNRFWSHQLLHCDVAWRNIGQREGSENLVLYDLVQVTKSKDDSLQSCADFVGAEQRDAKFASAKDGLLQSLCE
jgi:hypothetical protein